MAQPMQTAARPAAGGLRTLFWSLALIAMGGFGLYDQATRVGPDLMADFSLGTAAVPSPKGRIVDGKCRSQLALFQSCEATIVVPTPTGEARRPHSIMFLEPHMGRWEAQVLVDPARPDQPTTSLAMERLWNRVITLAGTALLSLGFLIGGVVMLLRQLGRWAGMVGGQARQA